MIIWPNFSLLTNCSLTWVMHSTVSSVSVLICCSCCNALNLFYSFRNNILRKGCIFTRLLQQSMAQKKVKNLCLRDPIMYEFKELYSKFCLYEYMYVSMKKDHSSYHILRSPWPSQKIEKVLYFCQSKWNNFYDFYK